MTKRYEVCSVDELSPGESKIVTTEDRDISIGVFNINGDYFALANVCPHQLAPLCEGTITGEMMGDAPGEFRLERDGEVIQCPWHGWKFNIKNGESVFNPHEVKTRTYETAVEHPQCTSADIEEYGAALTGEEPPVENFDVVVEDFVVVIYV